MKLLHNLAILPTLVTTNYTAFCCTHQNMQDKLTQNSRSHCEKSRSCQLFAQLTDLLTARYVLWYLGQRRGTATSVCLRPFAVQ